MGFYKYHSLLAFFVLLFALPTGVKAECRLSEILVKTTLAPPKALQKLPKELAEFHKLYKINAQFAQFALNTVASKHEDFFRTISTQDTVSDPYKNLAASLLKKWQGLSNEERASIEVKSTQVDITDFCGGARCSTEVSSKYSPEYRDLFEYEDRIAKLRPSDHLIVAGETIPVGAYLGAGHRTQIFEENAAQKIGIRLPLLKGPARQVKERLATMRGDLERMWKNRGKVPAHIPHVNVLSHGLNFEYLRVELINGTENGLVFVNKYMVTFYTLEKECAVGQTIPFPLEFYQTNPKAIEAQAELGISAEKLREDHIKYTRLLNYTREAEATTELSDIQWQQFVWDPERPSPDWVLLEW